MAANPRQERERPAPKNNNGPAPSTIRIGRRYRPQRLDGAYIEIVAPANFELFKKWQDEPWGKRGAEYDSLKEYFTERLLEQLYQKLPQLRGRID